MLSDERKGILQLLIALAWADGKVDEKERELVTALTEAFGATGDETEEIQQWAVEKRTLQDVNISALARSDLELALQYGVLLSYVDGEQTSDERRMLSEFVTRLGLTDDEAEPLLESASAYAKQLLPELAR
jgi:tellurite resistance protein